METIRFRALGFNVDVQQGFLLLLGFYALMDLAAQRPYFAILSWALVVFFSILVHELGHALAARSYGSQVLEVALWQLGGYVRHTNNVPRQRLFISLAGPFAGFAFGLPFLLAYWFVPMSWELRTIVFQLVFVNMAWGMVNLLPLLPLDGGNATVSLLRMYSKAPWRAVQTAAKISIVTSVGVALLGLSWGDNFLIFFGAILGYMNLQTVQQSSR